MPRPARRKAIAFGDKRVADITEEEIRALVVNNVAEGQDLEFKLAFAHKAPAARPELVRDVAALANGGGGYLLIGIREDGQSRAVALEGISGDVGACVTSIRDLCIEHLVPRVKNLEVRPRQVDGKTVIVVRVPRSALVPHMMTQTEATEFWIRHGDRKAYMRHEEIREAFLGRPPKASRPHAQKRVRHVELVQNGGFERGLQRWGTGLLEDMDHVQLVAQIQGFLPFGGAWASWSVDTRVARTGQCSLRVVHRSAYAPHVFSTLSQRIVVEPGAAYDATFWIKVEQKGRGAFCLRVVPSRGEWDRFKVKIQEGVADWRRYTVRFHSGLRPNVDLRFVAEGPIKAWIDDVTVRKVGEARRARRVRA